MRSIVEYFAALLKTALPLGVMAALFPIAFPVSAGELLGAISDRDPFGTLQLTSPSADQIWRPRAPLPQVPDPAHSPAPDSPLTLAELTDLALSNNPATREAWAAARAEAATLGLARSLYFPQLDGVASITHSKSISTGGVQVDPQTRYGPSLSLSYLIYDFGARANEVEAARYRLLAANLLQNRVLHDVVLSVEQAYYLALGLEQLLVANRQALKAAETALAAAQTRREAGLATIGDVYRAETAVGQARLTLKRNEGELAKARGQLATAAGIPVATSFTLAPWSETPEIAEISESVEQILTQAKQTRPDLIAAEAQARAARASVELARAAGRPTIELSSSVGRTFFTDDRPRSDSYSIGLALRIPLFTGFNRTYAIRQAEAIADQVEASRDRLFRQAELDVWQAYFDLNTAASAVGTSEGVLRTADQSAEVALARYKAGVGTLLDLLTAQSDQATARVQLIQSQLDWYTGLARLGHARGALLPDAVAERISEVPQ
jgi:TolC family type I secretion outer membrane protein